MEAAGLKIYKFVDEFDKTLGEELLTPTKIYVQEILSVVSNYEVHGIAHITGGAFSKLKRFEDYSKVGFILEELPTLKPIFRLIQEKGKISDEEMFNTFNMGVGICIIAPKDCYEDIISHCEKIGTRSFLIGEITQESGVRIEIENRTLKI